MKDPLSHALIYQWWPHSFDVRASHNLVAPVVASIATFRKYNPKIAVYVLDYLGGDFGNLQDRLDFQVIVRPSYFERFTPRREIKILPHGTVYLGKGPDEDSPVGADIFHLRFCSRPFDVWDLAQEIPQRYVTYADSDVFWFNSLLPFQCDPSKVCVRADNTGMFYFDKKSPDVHAFFELWKAYLVMARHDYKFRMSLVNAFKTPVYVSEEKVLLYLNSNIPAVLESLMNRIGPQEMLMSWDYHTEKRIDLEFARKFKSIHATGSIFGANKGRVPVLFTETFEALKMVFSPEEMIDIYGNVVFNHSIYNITDLGRPVDDPFFADLKNRVYADD